MNGSDFLKMYSGKPYTSWESAVVDLARSGSIVGWPLVPLTITDPASSKSVTLRVASDYLAVGTPDDFVRVPLTPLPAQRVADLFGMYLPTTKIATEIWRQAKVRLTPTPSAPNLGANLAQYADHSRLVDTQIAALGGAKGQLTNGQKKDVVVGNLLKPGKVIIFGWFWPDDPAVHGPYMTANLRASNPVQPYSDAHGDFYVDYSHGIRLVDGMVQTDQGPMPFEAAMRDPVYGRLLSDEGPLDAAHVRYPAPRLTPVKPTVPYDYNASIRTNPADRGLDVVRTTVAERSSS